MERTILGNYSIKLDNKNIIAIEQDGKKIDINGSIWSIDTIEPKGALSTCTVEDMSEFDFENTMDTLTLFWRNGEISVCAKIFIEDGSLKFHILADSKSGGINKIQFPRLGGLKPISEKGSEDYLVLPWQSGWLIKDPVHKLLQNKEVPFWMGRGGLKYENEYPAQYSYQFFALYSPLDFGVYFSTEDSEAYIKTVGFHYNPEFDGLDFILTNYPEDMGKIRFYSMPYNFSLRFFKGDWQTAAALYRKWAIKQKWCVMLAKKGISDRVKAIDFVRINHENYALGRRTEEYLKTCDIITKKLNAKTLIHWYGWNEAPNHGDYYPEMIPKDKINFTKKILKTNKRLDEMGIDKIPYVNTHLWDMNLKSYREENAHMLAVKEQDGSIKSEPWADALRPMCHGTSQMANKSLDLLTKIVKEYGFDGIYIDQVASFNAMLCFDSSHSHPLGGGYWWNREYHKQLQILRDIIGDDKILTTESCCESYHDLFDLFLILDTCLKTTGFPELAGGESCDAIPLFSMIYGDSALGYGSVCKLSDPIELFEFKLVRNILWGIIPTAEGMPLDEMTDKDAYWEILKKCVDFYKGNKEMFLYGRVSGIPNYKCESLSLKWEGNGKSFAKSYPLVCASLFEYNETESILLYNFGDREQSIHIDGENITVATKSFLRIPLTS